MKRVLHWIVPYLVAFLSLVFLLEMVNRGTAEASSSYDELYNEASQSIQEVNRRTPYRAGPGLRIDSVSISRSTGIRYRQTFTEIYPGHVDRQTSLRNQRLVRDSTINSDCNNEAIARLILGGIAITRHFHYASGEKAFTVIADRSACQHAGHM